MIQIDLHLLCYELQKLKTRSMKSKMATLMQTTQWTKQKKQVWDCSKIARQVDLFAIIDIEESILSHSQHIFQHIVMYFRNPKEPFLRANVFLTWMTWKKYTQIGQIHNFTLMRGEEPFFALHSDYLYAFSQVQTSKNFVHQTFIADLS